MKNKIWYVIGLMSGTSLDGVDLVYVKISRNSIYSFEILESKSIEYSELWKKKLFDAFDYSGAELAKLDVDYGKHLGELIQVFIRENEIENIDFISSHGHTIFHQPESNFTKQIGSGTVISALTNQKVICDFRVQDVALGGQGAPLVPVGDMLLFEDYDYCLNLGGFVNISFQKIGDRIAFDICPINIVMNFYTRKIGLEYDDKGMLASQGEIQYDLLNKLNDLPFYKNEKPKSLGFEFVHGTVLPLIDSYDLSIKDILRTFVEHVAYQIYLIILKNKQDGENVKESKKKIFITGGGAFNDFLIERLDHYITEVIIIPDKEIIDFKEALIFAILGVLKDEGEVNCLRSVTGAIKDHSSGVVFEA